MNVYFSESHVIKNDFQKIKTTKMISTNVPKRIYRKFD